MRQGVSAPASSGAGARRSLGPATEVSLQYFQREREAGLYDGEWQLDLEWKVDELDRVGSCCPLIAKDFFRRTRHFPYSSNRKRGPKKGRFKEAYRNCFCNQPPSQIKCLPEVKLLFSTFFFQRHVDRNMFECFCYFVLWCHWLNPILLPFPQDPSHACSLDSIANISITNM